MKIIGVTCSGANEHTDLSQLGRLKMQQMPVPFCGFTELGVQVSEQSAAFATARYWWLEALYHYLLEHRLWVTLSLQLTEDWAEDFCAGKISPELAKFLCLRRRESYYPFVQRVQVEIGQGKKPNADKLVAMIRRFSEQRFVLEYNEGTADLLEQVSAKRMPFDCLFTEPFDKEKKVKPKVVSVFPEFLHGFVSGVSGQSLATDMQKLNEALPKDRKIWLTAGDCMKDEDGYLSFARCNDFIQAAMLLS